MKTLIQNFFSSVPKEKLYAQLLFVVIAYVAHLALNDHFLSANVFGYITGICGGAVFILQFSTEDVAEVEGVINGTVSFSKLIADLSDQLAGLKTAYSAPPVPSLAGVINAVQTVQDLPAAAVVQDTVVNAPADAPVVNLPAPAPDPVLNPASVAAPFQLPG